MVGVMNGIRVVEVAAWTYVPVAGALLTEWGAAVLKIEHTETGDTQRGLVSSGLIPAGGVNHMFELPNRGKRSVALDLKTEEGRDLLMKIVETADVFLTNFRPGARKKLRIDVDDVRAHNDKIIYVRGSAAGQRVGGEARIVDQFRTSEHVHQLGEVAIGFQHHQCDGAVVRCPVAVH